MLLYYSTTYPNSIIQYKYINVVLHMDSDAAYITMSEARSFYTKHFLSERLAITKADKNYPQEKRSYPQIIQNNLQCSIPIIRGWNMWNFQQQRNWYRRATSLNGIVSQSTSYTSQNRQSYDRRFCKIRHKTKFFKNMGYKMALVNRQGGSWETYSILAQRNKQQP